MHVLMFYLLDQTLISSLISSSVTHLTLKTGLRVPSYLTLPTVLASRLPTGELEVADSVGEAAFVYTCLEVALCLCTMHSYMRCFCMFACARVNVCDRCGLLCQGWGRTLPIQPRCLQRFVSTQQVIGWTPYTPSHTHTPSPRDVITLNANSRPPRQPGKMGRSQAALSTCF